MPSAHSRREAMVLEAMRPRLEAEGFEVFVRPDRRLLPPFFGAFRPDAIALTSERKIAFEFANTQRGGSSLKRLEALLSPHKDWELQVIHAPETDQPSLSVTSRHVMEDNLERTLAAFDIAGPAAAILTAWSVLEAAARALEPIAFAHPQPADRLVERLAFEGYVSPDEAEMLRRLLKLRNEAAHGSLETVLTRADLESIAAVARTLIAMQETDSPV